MKSIIYKPLITQYKPPSTPDFKPKGYRPQYNWKDSESAPTSEPAPEITSEETPAQNSAPTETWVNPTGTTLITDLNDLAYQRTPTQSSTVSHIFKDSSIDVGNMQELLDKFAEAGISLRITSGYRPGVRTKQGNQSWHSQGYALDVTPGTNETWDSLRSKLKNSPDLIKYMQDQGFGIIDETTSEMQSRTGATGAHWHIGKDKLAQSGLRDIISARSGTKLPIIYAKPGRKLEKQRHRVTEQLLSINNPRYRDPLTNTDKPLEPVSIASILPGTGDVAEGASIVDNILNKNIIQALISVGLFALPGNVSKVTKTLGFNYPYIKGDLKTNTGIFKDKGVDKDLKNIESLLATRYKTKGNRIPELPQQWNRENISDIIQNWEPQIRENLTLDGNRNFQQGGWYTHNKITNQPSELVIGDKKLTTKELNTKFTPETENYLISEESRRQMLDHEIQHWVDETFRPKIANSKIDFLANGAEDDIINPLEIIARTGQVKSYNNIKDGSKIFTGKEYQQMFENYLNDKQNPDNFISSLKDRIKNWDEFARWANRNVPLISKSSKVILWNKDNTDESND